MKKLFYFCTSVVLCLMFGLFAGCEKPLEGSDNPNGGDGTMQTGTIEGVVTSKDTDKPVFLATVILLSAERVTITDSAGTFRFSDVATGTHKIQIKGNGYTLYTSGDIKVEAGKTVRHNVALETIKSDLQILNANGEIIDELQIEDDATKGTFVLKNTGTKIIEWEIPKLAVKWISGFTMLSGKLAPGAADNIEFSIDRSQLSDGLNETTLYIGSSVGDRTLLIKAGVERSFRFTNEAGNEILDVDMSDVDQYRFTIKNTGNDALTWNMRDIDADWLTLVGKTDGALAVGESETRTLKVDRTRLEEEGTYETTLVFRSNAGEKTLPVKVKIELSFRLENEYGSEITELKFNWASSQQFRIKNTGNGILTWAIPTVGANWITLGNKRSGSLQPGSAETITATIDRTKLSVGDNQVTVDINTNAGGKPLNINAHVELSYRLENTQGAEISELDLGRAPQGSFRINNTGNGYLAWELSSDNADWLSLGEARSGSLSLGSSATIELTVDFSKLSEGANETTLHISSPAGNKQLPVRFSNYVAAVGADYVETVGGVELQMVAVQGGSFLMGATEEQGSDAADDEKPAHQVMLDGFYIGKYEVTQAQWEEVMGTTVEQQRNATNPTYSLPGVGDEYPMYYVNLAEATSFCEELSRRTGKKYRLPTEAEWEYAARGGHNPDGTKYAGSNAIGQVAWYNVNSNEQTQPVGTKQPNGLGVYDMSGNVYEWCSDKYDAYSSSPAVNPQGPASGSEYVRRGASYYQDASSCRVSFRNHSVLEQRANNLGFRIVCEP